MNNEGITFMIFVILAVMVVTTKMAYSNLERRFNSLHQMFEDLLETTTQVAPAMKDMMEGINLLASSVKNINETIQQQQKQIELLQKEVDYV